MLTACIFPCQPNVSGTNSTAAGPGLEKPVAHLPTNFTIQSRDDKGTPVTTGGEHFSALLKPAGSAATAQPLSVTDKGDGTYPVAYTPSAAGPVEIDVRHGDTPIKGSPFKVNVSPLGDSCTAAGPGLKAPEVGVAKPFIVSVKDPAGKPVTGHHKLAVNITDKTGAPVKVDDVVADPAKGTFNVTYTPTHAGAHKIAVDIYDTPVQGSPFTADAASNIDLSKTTASGPGLKRAAVGKKAPFVIEALNKDGKPVENADFAVQITGPGKVEPTLTPSTGAPGKTDVVYVCPTPGEYTVQVTHEGKPVSGTPVKLNVKKPGVPKRTTATKYSILVSVYDEDGVKVADQPLVANVQKGDATVECTVKDLANGDYLVEYGSSGSGTYEIQVLLDGEHIAGSPFTETQK